MYESLNGEVFQLRRVCIGFLSFLLTVYESLNEEVFQLRRVCIGFLSFLLSISLCTGCASTANNQGTGTTTGLQSGTSAAKNTKSSNGPSYLNATGFPIAAKDIPPMRMLVAQNENQKPADELQYFIEMEKLTGVKWEFIQPASSGFQEQMNLMFSSNDLPDAVYNAGISVSNEYNWGTGGVIIPLEKLIADYGENFKTVMKQYPDISKSITSADGHIYTMPNVNNSPKEVQRIWINYNWSTKWGLTKYDDTGVYERHLPSTLDEFYALLARFRDEDPNGNGIKDELPLSFEKNMFGHTADITTFTPSEVIMSYFGMVGKGISEENGKIIFTCIDDRYKEYLRFMNKLFKEKLLDKESFTQNADQLKAKGKANLIGITGGWNAIAYQYSEGSDLDKLKGTSMPALTSKYSSKPVFPLATFVNPGTFAITKACKYPEVAFRWIDVNYSSKTEDILRVFWGGSWKWEDNTQKLWVGVVPDGQGESWRTENLTNASDNATPFFADTVTMDLLQGGTTGITDRYKFRDAERFTDAGRPAIPVLGFTPDELESIATYGPDIYNYSDQMEASFITGQTDLDSGWDAYVNTLAKMNLPDLVKVYQTAYDRFKAAK